MSTQRERSKYSPFQGLRGEITHEIDRNRRAVPNYRRCVYSLSDEPVPLYRPTRSHIEKVNVKLALKRYTVQED